MVRLDITKKIFLNFNFIGFIFDTNNFRSVLGKLKKWLPKIVGFLGIQVEMTKTVKMTVIVAPSVKKFKDQLCKLF